MKRSLLILGEKILHSDNGVVEKQIVLSPKGIDSLTIKGSDNMKSIKMLLAKIALVILFIPVFIAAIPFLISDSYWDLISWLSDVADGK